MKQAWICLWTDIGAKGDALKAYNDLLRRYAEPHRHYHDLGHIEHCLVELQQVRDLAVNYPTIAMALWYHDAIYNTKAQDNEEMSAALASDTLQTAFVGRKFTERVAKLILATKHIRPPDDNDEKIIVDIDLSSFGLPDEMFDQNTLAIREEYDWVPEAIFAKERAKILQLFLDRKPLYSTTFFRDKYEAPAKRNLERAIVQLSRLF